MTKESDCCSDTDYHIPAPVGVCYIGAEQRCDIALELVECRQAEGHSLIAPLISRREGYKGELQDQFFAVVGHQNAE